jgi:hypothetical protein
MYIVYLFILLKYIYNKLNIMKNNLYGINLIYMI